MIENARTVRTEHFWDFFFVRKLFIQFFFVIKLYYFAIFLHSLLFCCKGSLKLIDCYRNHDFCFVVTGREMLHEKSKEIDGLNKEFQRQIQVLVEDHKKEVDVSI